METISRKEQRAKWFKPRGNLPTYKRPDGPPQPELTKEDASKIFDVSGSPSHLATYKDRIVQYMVEYSTTLKPTQRVPVKELIEQSQSVCGKEIQRGVQEINPSWTDEQKMVVLYGVAMALVNGYKQQYESHFEVDPKTNEIIDLVHPHENRQPQCDEFLKQKRSEMARRQFAATGEPYDPYRGSQQGIGRRKRKTKKHSKKSKKTLRRK